MSHKELNFQYIYIKVCKTTALRCVHVVNSQMVCRRRVFAQGLSLQEHADATLAA